MVALAYVCARWRGLEDLAVEPLIGGYGELSPVEGMYPPPMLERSVGLGTDSCGEAFGRNPSGLSDRSEPARCLGLLVMALGPHEAILLTAQTITRSMESSQSLLIEPRMSLSYTFSSFRSAPLKPAGGLADRMPISRVQ